MAVDYFVGGSATSADITYTTSTGDTAQQSGVDVPLTRQDGARGLVVELPPGAFAYISAQNTGEVGSIACRIVVNGETVKATTSYGGYTIATCSTAVPG